ncbi:MAG: SAM-dependent chlorinase/fluorinase [Ekhidna sp.]
MAVITFLSDFGTQDHYVAAVKAAIVSESPQQPIADISHDIRPYDIAHAANVLRNVYKEFPKGSVHLVAVDAMRERARMVALELEDHLFVGFDTGLFSLISEKEPTQIRHIENGTTTFPAKEVLARVALQLAGGTPLQKVGQPVDTITKLFGRQLKVTKREIAGNVMRVDHYGNLITNISKEEFEKILEINGASVSYQIRFGREAFRGVHSYFTDVESGECYVLFNSSGNLQIGINKGNASQLLGLAVDAPVIIEFTNE